MKKSRLGQELIVGMKEILAHSRGEVKLRERVVEIPDPVKPWPRGKIAKLRRKRFRVSQPVFAAMLNVKPATVRAWEQGLKKPSGAAWRLLQLAELEPRIFELAAGLGASRVVSLRNGRADGPLEWLAQEREVRQIQANKARATAKR